MSIPDATIPIATIARNVVMLIQQWPQLDPERQRLFDYYRTEEMCLREMASQRIICRSIWKTFIATFQ
jgi:hypothetical protein